MTAPKKLFLDSDVIVSSLISNQGAAFEVVNRPNASLFISNYSQKELQQVIERLKLDEKKLEVLIKNQLEKTQITLSSDQIKTNFNSYVLDPNDAHIVAGAAASKADFLLTYNTRHYKIDRIKIDFGIITLSPGHYLQYLRSLAQAT